VQRMADCSISCRVLGVDDAPPCVEGLASSELGAGEDSTAPEASETQSSWVAVSETTGT
jgi:hypothetical protein